jgi:hypothetical protein
MGVEGLWFILRAVAERFRRQGEGSGGQQGADDKA